MFGWAMEGLSASQGIKKQPLIPHMGQELYSCDTTQIGVVKHPLASRAITRARWITGGNPSAATKKLCSGRPQKSIHTTAPRPAYTVRDSLQVRPVGYYSSSKVFSDSFVVAIIYICPRFVNTFLR